ncbi:MAG: EamA family transporter [Lachnospiraceae bacterium]|nr:EamA family transporter [Lachnospiraceae bacterium]
MVNKYMLLLVLSVVVASFSQILLKKSAKKTYESVIREYLNPFVIIGYGMMVLSTLLTVGGYAGLEYKNGAVIESLGFVLVMFLSRIFFEEKITKKKLWGNILILLGIFVFYS